MEEEIKYCQNCKRDISVKNYVIHTAYCEKNIQLCVRCSEPVPRTELENHEEEFHSKGTCSECGISVEKWQIEKHKETCEKRLVPCKYCELEVPLDNLSEHSLACGSRTELCSKCKKHVMLKDLEKHLGYCSQKKSEAVPCEHCGRNIDWNEFMEHILLCGTRRERCFLCNEYIMVKDRVTHLITCEKEEKALPCKHCGLRINWNEMMDHTTKCGSRKEACFLCNKQVMHKDMDAHFVNCAKARDINEDISCDYCGETFSNTSIRKHVEFCKSQAEKCDKCNCYIQRKDLEFHLSVCKQGTQLRSKVSNRCKYCRKLFPNSLLEDHVSSCRFRSQKCEKCDNYIPLTDLETHLCKESISKIYGDCSICHQSIPWMEMNAHTAYCVHVNSEKNEYELQNHLNELTLKNESEVLTNKISDEKRSQLAEAQKRCSFCFENFLCSDFSQHLKSCQERPYNCEECLKAMPYRNKEKHERSCLGQRTKALADDYILHSEETDDNKEFKKFKKCQFCDSRLPDVLFQNHLKECDLREEKCEVCLENVPVKDMPDHKLLKCNFPRLAKNRNFNDRKNMYAEATPKPSMNFEGKEYLEKFVEICPSCKSKIPEARYHEHLFLCYNGETLCHFCGIKISKKYEHLHYRTCDKILQIIKEDNNSQSKKKNGNVNRVKSLVEKCIPFWNYNKKNSFESNNTLPVSQVSLSWESNTGRSYERDNITPMRPSTTRLNEANELPCEFCDQMWPAELLIEHESGCRPDLVSFPKTEEGNVDDQKFPSAAATASQNLHTPVLDASSKSIREDNEWKLQSRRSNKLSIRESIDHRKNDKNLPLKQHNAKEKFFYYPSQDTDNVRKNQNGNLKKKRYPQVTESQETVKTKPDKEIGVKKDDPKKDEFTSFRFSTSSGVNMELQNTLISKKENEDVPSTDMKNYDETKKNDISYDSRAFSAESVPMVNFSKSNFNREIRAVGAERAEKKRIMHSSKDVDNDNDFKEISVQKLITFDANKTELPTFLENSESRTANLSVPAIWNTEGSLSSEKPLRNHLLKSFGSDIKAKDSALSNAVEIEHLSFNSNMEETDYDVKNTETFGSGFMESINSNQDDENDVKSDRSNSDDTFYDADDGGTKYFDAVNDNFHGSSIQEDKFGHCNLNNSKFSGNQKENINPSSHVDSNTDIRLEDEDLKQKDCDLGGYIQFLQTHSYETAGDCKCGNEECYCEQSSSIQKASPPPCTFKDTADSQSHSESMDIKPLIAEAKTSHKMKSKKSKKIFEGEDIDKEMKWKKWRLPEKKCAFSSDSE